MVALTAVGLAIGKGLSEFRSHVDIEMLAELILDFSRFHAFVNHGLDPYLVQSVENVTDPLLVDMNPITGVWHVPEQVGVTSRMFQEVSHSEALNLGHCCNLDLISLDVLNMANQGLGNTLPPSFQT